MNYPRIKYFEPSLISLCLLIFSLQTNLFAQREDILILRNGDKVTGEIKLLEYGILDFKTDKMGTIEVEWDIVDQLISKNRYEIELIDGKEYFGSLAEVLTSTSLGIADDDTLLTVVYTATVVRITPIKDRFWSRVNGGVSLGIDYKKANDIGNLNFDSDFTYRSRLYEVAIKLNSGLTFQTDRSPARRADLSGSVINFLGNRWFIGGILGLSQNTELGLNLRLFATGAYGRLLISTNHNRLITTAGLSVNREWTTSNTENSYNLEAVLSAVFSIFVYNTPETDFTTSVNVFPNLTTKGRVRIDFESKLKQEIIKDFSVNFSIYLNYDSKPPSSSVTKADYGITFGLGYTL